MKAHSYAIIFLTAVTATGVRGERYLRAEISNKEENNMMMSFSYNQPVETYRIFRNSNDDIDMSAKEDRGMVAMQAVVPSNSLTNQIIYGYQGWYAYPGDGAPINRWKHWFRNQPVGEPQPTHEESMIDLFPETDEYDDEDLKESTGIVLPDGSNAKFFSNARPKVVLKHFEWMRTYGLTGVFHNRFIESIHLNNNREWKTMVLRNVKAAAEETGRVFAVSYNIAGKTLDCTALDTLKDDWKRLVDEEKITESDRYIHHNDKPVLSIYGIGFTTVPSSACPEKMINLINWFHGLPDSGGNTAPQKYQGFVMGGVPSEWKDLTGDSRTAAVWKDVYESLDAIHPWHVGRWSTINNFYNYYNNIITRDANYCAQRGILYVPTMWAGFSWHNLKQREKPINDIPRLGGEFLWAQAYRYASNSNINSIWMAQFDEMDESTAIFKVKARSSDLPTEGTFLALDADGYDLPSDWYLRLVGEAQRMLEGSRSLTTTIPLDPSDPPPATPNPTSRPTNVPTSNPTSQPSGAPTGEPTTKPTTSPTQNPTPATEATTSTTDATTTATTPETEATTTTTTTATTTTTTTTAATTEPSSQPTSYPTTAQPTSQPTSTPTTRSPTPVPTSSPTPRPTSAPVRSCPWWAWWC